MGKVTSSKAYLKQDKIGSFKFMEAGYSQSLSYKLALKIAFSMDSHTNLENQPPRGAD